MNQVTNESLFNRLFMPKRKKKTFEIFIKKTEETKVANKYIYIFTFTK